MPIKPDTVYVYTYSYEQVAKNLESHNCITLIITYFTFSRNFDIDVYLHDIKSSIRPIELVMGNKDIYTCT